MSTATWLSAAFHHFRPGSDAGQGIKSIRFFERI